MTAEHKPHPIEEAVESVYRDIAKRSLGQRSRRLLGCHRITVHQDGGWCEDNLGHLLDNAQNQGVISEQEIDEVWRIRTITSGENPRDGSTTYAAMDLAVTVQDRHINRLAARSDILRRAAGKPVVAAVMGAFISSDSLRQLAQERGVSLIHFSLDLPKWKGIFQWTH